MLARRPSIAPSRPPSAARRPSAARHLCAGALTLVMVIAIGCGSEKTDRVTGGVLRLDVDEYRILPQRVSIPPGRVKILIHDVGTLTHNVHVEDPSQLDAQGNPLELGGTPTAHPGTGKGTRQSKVLLLARGTYRLVCTIANHEVLGQYATLEVR